MRKTSDLVDEMFAEAKDAWLVAIVVGFENETKFVFSSRRHPLEKLNQLVQKGGSPIGLLRFVRENTTVQGSYRPFVEYETAEWTKKYFTGLLEHTGDIIAMSQEKESIPTAY